MNKKLCILLLVLVCGSNSLLFGMDRQHVLSNAQAVVDRVDRILESVDVRNRAEADRAHVILQAVLADRARNPVAMRPVEHDTDVEEYNGRPAEKQSRWLGCAKWVGTYVLLPVAVVGAIAEGIMWYRDSLEKNSDK